MVSFLQGGPARAGLEWFSDAALPIWLEYGLDRRRGGFYEYLDPETLDCDADFRRLRVVTRQIYVFSAALRLGLPEARSGLEHGLAFLLGPARHPEGGFANRFDLEGRVTDPTRDLYDLAFAGFAMAHAMDVTGDTALRDEARTLAGLIQNEMTHPDGGFLEALPPQLPRRQNPHMHLLEAALAWSELDPDGPWAELARTLVDLFHKRLLDVEAGCLPEFFNERFGPLSGSKGEIVEPGHHFEWVWLLHHAGRLGFAGPGDAAERLYEFAHVHGLDPLTGVPYGEINRNGALLTGQVRLWAATEWVKAEAVRPGSDAGARMAGAWAVVAGFLDTPRRGLWYERWTPSEKERGQGAFVPGPAPATSLYHIVLAIETLCAVERLSVRGFADVGVAV